MQMAQGKSEDISIHAPTKGATLMPGIMEVQYRFQSTLPRRERLGGVIVMMKYIPISIHAPTKGATMAYEKRSASEVYFNPRSHEGSDHGTRRTGDNNPDFNPRSHEGSDPNMPRSERAGVYFNPRSHEGSDLVESDDMEIEKQFQSTLPRRERHCIVVLRPTKVNFNPRSHEGSD